MRVKGIMVSFIAEQKFPEAKVRDNQILS